MGLLDYLTNSGNGDPGGGLLSFLNSLQQGQPPSQMGPLPSDQAQYGTPSAQAPVFAPQPAQANAQPSPLDNAQWPPGPVGAPSQAMAQVPQQPPAVIPGPQNAPAAPAPQEPGFLDRLNTGLQSLGHGGSIIGALTGNLTDPTSIAKAQQTQVANVTAKALIAKGVDPQTAIAAVQPGNTEMLKTLVTQNFGQSPHTQETDKDGNVWDINKQTGQRTIALAAKDDKFQHFVVKNPDGSESVKSFNTKTGEVTAVPGSGAADRPAVDPGSVGPERMKQLQAADPNYARRVQAAVDGDIQLPTQGQAARSPAAARFTEDVLAVSGSTSASDFATKAATRKDYASGIASRVTKSINTTIGHFATLDDTIDKLGNHTYFPGITNYVHDKIASNTDPEYQKAKATFETNKEAAIKELDFALSGGHSSVSGSAEIRDKFNRADSPETLHAAVTEAMSLLQKRLQSHAKAFSEGTKAQRDEQDFIYPENRASFNKLLGSKDTSTGQSVPGISAAAAAPAPAPQGGPAPGAYVWSPDGGVQPK